MSIILPGWGVVYYGGSTIDTVCSLEIMVRFLLKRAPGGHLGCDKVNDWV